MTPSSNPLRVLHVIPSIGRARGGPSFVVRTLAEGQAELGLEVHVAATDDDGPRNRIPPRSVPFTEHGVTYWVFPRQTRFYLFSFPLTRWLWRHLRDYDVIHIHALFSYASTAASLLSARAGIPYLVRPLGTLNQWGMRNRRHWLKKLSFLLIERPILKRAAAVHYTSEQERIEARQLGVPENGVIVPNPVDFSGYRFLPRISGRDGIPSILFLSRLDPKKGLDLLLPAFAHLRAEHPKARLVIAGDGPTAFVDMLRRQSAKLGLDEFITWNGFLQGDAKKAAFAESDFYVLPSYSENFGVSVVEAMAAGLPVVVTDQVGIHREISQAGAGIVVSCSVESVASGLREMLQDTSRRAAMAQCAAELAQQFTPQTIVRQLDQLYVEIRCKYRQPVAA